MFQFLKGFTLFLCLLASVSHAEEIDAERFQKMRQDLRRYYQYNLNKLAAQQKDIIGIEVLIAKGFNEHIYSQFGHTFLRFVHKDGLWAKDVTVSFVADIQTPEFNYAKGTIGTYPVIAEIKSLYEFWQEYVADERRELLRYVIPVSPGDIHNMISTLQRWQARPELMGNYTFLSNNCTHVLAQFLIHSGLSYEQHPPKKPFSLPDWLEKSLMNVYPPLTVLNQRMVINKLTRLLGSDEATLKKGQWPEQSYELMGRQLNEKEIKFVYDYFLLIPTDISEKVARDFHYSKTAVNYSVVMSMDNLGAQLYRVCVDDACLKKIIELAQTTWSNSDLEKKRDRLRFILNNYSIKGTYVWDPNSGGSREDTFNVVHLKSPDLETFFKKYWAGLNHALAATHRAELH
jgi:hypothetical protein